MATKSLDIIVRAIDRTSKPLAGIQGAFGRVGSGIKVFGSTVLAGVGLGTGAAVVDTVLRIGKAAIMTGVDFEEAMSKVRSVTGAGATDMRKLSDAAVKFGTSTAFSAEEAASAMYELGSAGLSPQQIIAAMPATLDLAAAGSLGMADAANIAAAAMNNMDLKATDMPHVADVFAQAANKSATDVMEIGEAFKFVGPIGKVFGKDIEQVVSPLEVLANAGVRAEMAGTGLRQVFSKLSGESKPVNSLMADLGINVEQLKLMPLADQIDLINEKMASMGGVEKAGELLSAFGERGGPTMAILLAKGGDALRQMEGDLRNAGGTAAEAARVKLDNVAGAWKRLKGVASGAAISVFEGIKPAIRGLIDGVADGVTLLRDIFGGIGSFLEPAMGTMTKIFSAGGSAVSAVWALAWQAIKTTASVAWEAVKAVFSAFTGAMGGFGITWQGIGDTIIRGLIAIEFVAKNWRDVFSLAMLKAELSLVTFGDRTKWVFGVVSDFLGWFGRNWTDVFVDAFNVTKTVFLNLTNNIVDVIKNIPALISGELSFADLWTPLTTGFESSLKELPQIAAFQSSELANQLGSDVQELESSVGQKWGDFLDKRLGELAAPGVDRALEDFFSFEDDIANGARQTALGKPGPSVPVGGEGEAAPGAEGENKKGEGNKPAPSPLASLVESRFLTGVQQATQYRHTEAIARASQQTAENTKRTVEILENFFNDSEKLTDADLIPVL